MPTALTPWQVWWFPFENQQPVVYSGQPKLLKQYLLLIQQEEHIAKENHSSK